ncbi:ribulose-phosphate 3-epimerase [Lachnospiraceae bacterium ZAX-1]
MNCLAPSLLAADFTKIGEQIRQLNEGGAQYLHLDIMDGMFVPSISFGMPVIKSLRPYTEQIFDVHLMIEKPERYIEQFVEAGADIITVHAEACTHLDRTIMAIKEHGVAAAVALNPATDLCLIDYVLPQLDMVLLMTVNPGFGGQSYITYCTEKIRQLKRKIDQRGLTTDIEVDGGIYLGNVREALRAGANIIVAGSAIFKGDITKNVADFMEILK